MGIVRIAGDKFNWSEKRVKRIEGFLDLMLWFLIVTMAYLGVSQIAMINECKDVISCQSPFGEILEGTNTSKITYVLCPNASINNTLLPEIPILETSVID